jgi:membrane-bound serine protease (ClpP class)
MAPGTSMGAAHPVAQDGKDIEGDMRAKAENSTAAMVKAIADQRGRNKDWAEKAVKESVSVTAKEALELGVIDFVAEDITTLLKQAAGREVKLKSDKLKLEDLSKLPRERYEISAKNQAVNLI